MCAISIYTCTQYKGIYRTSGIYIHVYISLAGGPHLLLTQIFACIWQALHVADYFGTVIIHDLKIITEPIQCTFNSSALLDIRNVNIYRYMYID